MITLDQLRRCMPSLAQDRAEEMVPHLAAAAEEFEIDSPLRLAAFIAQLAHESGELRWMEELASGRAYEGRRDLGNTQQGAIEAASRRGTTPGRFYKGHGPIQITGYSNHKQAGEALGIDAVNHPELLASPEHGFRAAGLFWKTRKLNPLADSGVSPTHVQRVLRSGKTRIETHPAFDVIGFKINGGWNGKEERRRYYRLAREVFGLEPWEEKA